MTRHPTRIGLGISLALLTAAIAATAAEPKKKEQPLTPGGKWPAHSMQRPRPPVITPAPAGAPVPPPSDAIALFDGKDLSQWTRDPRGNDPDKSPTPKWKIENGYAEVVPGGGGISTRDKFGDAQLHIEWATPAEVKGSSQGRGNSGVLLHGIGEVQVLDSFENDTYPDGQAGAIYGKYPPLVNASRKPGEWQTYDIIVQCAQLDEQGKRVAPMRLTVFHNGVLVQHAAELDSTAREWGFGLQDHLNPMRFQNIWIRKLSFDLDTVGTAPPTSVKPAPAPKKSAANRVPAAKMAAVPPARSASVARVVTATASHPFAPAPVAGLDEGEHLLAILSCSSCHSASGIPGDRFVAKKAPLMGKEGMRLSPQFLRDYLANPQAEKPGTTMPDVLHGLPATEKAEAVDALVHFLLSQSPTNDPPTVPNETLIARGRTLYHEIGCVACHAPHDGNASPEVVAQLEHMSIPHGYIAKKFTVPQLAEFLTNPSKFRPARRMPSSNLKKDEALALAMYLLRDQASGGGGTETKLTKGLRFEYFKGDFKDCGPALDKAKPERIGSIGSIDVSQWTKGGDGFGARFTGQFDVPAPGKYTFYTTSDDGSRLWIDGVQVVDNDGKHGKEEKSGTIELRAGKHAFVLSYFQNAKSGWALSAAFEGPGLKKKPFKGGEFTHVAGVMRPLLEKEFKLDDAKAARGRKLYGELGCAQCHHTPGVTGIPAPAFTAKKLLELKADSSFGCLASEPGRRSPQFNLSSAQAAALRHTLANSAALKKPLSPGQEIVRVMNSLNCYACHARNEVGGPQGVRAEFFKSAGEADLGEEGRLPPHLTKVGAKLRPEWLADVLMKKGAVRHYMVTRMPQFGPPVVEKLPALFAAADGAGAVAPASAYDRELAKHGRMLVGTGGYACVQCHSFGKYPSLGVPAIDLTTAPTRLRPDWFARYLVDPAKLRPGTRMPTFWPDGRAANTNILGGDVAKQVAAIGMYLSKGGDTDAPPGIVQAKMELVAEKEAQIYRHFIQGAGARAIGVGYPEKANLAWDANDLRLALVWQGAFIDAAKHRTGRGSGFESPMGYNVQSLAPGAPFAVLASESAAWPDKSGKEADYQFHGYTLDAKQRPTFRYNFGELSVEEFPEPIAAIPDPGLKRTFTLRASKPVANLYFRAAVSPRIQDKGGGVFVVDGSIKLKFPGSEAFLRPSGNTMELLVPVKFEGSGAKLVEEIAW